MSERSVVVVGGGLAGLAAALECAEAGARVRLLEARPRVGGATFSIERDGLSMDNGQHVFLRCCTAYREFLARLGVEGDVVLQGRLDVPVLAPGGRRGRLRRNNLRPPLHLAASLARYPFLGPRDKLRLLPAIRALSALDLADPSLDERTFGAWLAEHGQSRRAQEALWDLITVPTVNLPAREASLALAAKVFQTGLLEEASAGDVGYARVPLQRLHGDAAARKLERLGATIETKARVTAIEPGPAVVADGRRLDADAVVLAVPHEDAAELLPDRPDLSGLGASPILNLHVVYDRRVNDLPLAAGVGTPVQWVFDRTDSGGLERGQYLAVSLSGADEWAGRSVDELRAVFEPALAELFPAARDAVVERFFVTREQRATFRGAPGTARLRARTATSTPGLFLAGAWTDTGWPATMEGAVRSGIAAGRAALATTAALEGAAA